MRVYICACACRRRRYCVTLASDRSRFDWQVGVPIKSAPAPFVPPCATSLRPLAYLQSFFSVAFVEKKLYIVGVRRLLCAFIENDVSMRLMKLSK